VPADAVVWDATADAWVPVAAGTQATSKVTFDYAKYFQSHWHDGQPITIADAVYSIAQGFDLAYDPNKAQVEVAIAATSRPYLETFQGFRVTDDDKIEVYVDYWHFDQDQIAAYASPTSLSMPWEVLAAMDDLVFDQRHAAYSDTGAGRYDVPWLNLVLTRDARLVDRTLRQFAQQGAIPAGVFQMGDRTLVTPDQATARYQAAQDWFDQYGHLVISNGPFLLSKYDPPAQFAQLDAFRDPTYPFTAKDFDLGPPPQLSVDPLDGATVTMGQEASFTVQVHGDGQLALRFLLIDSATGLVVLDGDGIPGANPGEFTVTIGADVAGSMLPGLYRLDLAASSDATALISERTADIEVTP
jgi:peptide/nickel transport system substrate-binding protein